MKYIQMLMYMNNKDFTFPQERPRFDCNGFSFNISFFFLNEILLDFIIFPSNFHSIL